MNESNIFLNYRSVKTNIYRFILSQTDVIFMTVQHQNKTFYALIADKILTRRLRLYLTDFSIWSENH